MEFVNRTGQYELVRAFVDFCDRFHITVRSTGQVDVPSGGLQKRRPFQHFQILTKMQFSAACAIVPAEILIDGVRKDNPNNWQNIEIALRSLNDTKLRVFQYTSLGDFLQNLPEFLKVADASTHNQFAATSSTIHPSQFDVLNVFSDYCKKSGILLRGRGKCEVEDTSGPMDSFRTSECFELISNIIARDLGGPPTFILVDGEMFDVYQSTWKPLEITVRNKDMKHLRSFPYSTLRDFQHALPKILIPLEEAQQNPQVPPETPSAGGFQERVVSLLEQLDERVRHVEAIISKTPA